jgi:hypothetical protein
MLGIPDKKISQYNFTLVFNQNQEDERKSGLSEVSREIYPDS